MQWMSLKSTCRGKAPSAAAARRGPGGARRAAPPPRTPAPPAGTGCAPRNDWRGMLARQYGYPMTLTATVHIFCMAILNRLIYSERFCSERSISKVSSEIKCHNLNIIVFIYIWTYVYSWRNHTKLLNYHFIFVFKLGRCEHLSGSHYITHYKKFI